MLFSQQFEDTPPMDDFLDPSLLERDDEALLVTPPRSSLFLNKLTVVKLHFVF